MFLYLNNYYTWYLLNIKPLQHQKRVLLVGPEPRQFYALKYTQDINFKIKNQLFHIEHIYQ